MLMPMHGMMDEQYSEDLAKKTKRGLEGAVERGYHTGGPCFGYRSMAVHSKVKDGSVEGYRLAIDPAQARTVRRMYSMYANGASFKTIAHRLNKEGVARLSWRAKFGT